jgi:iron(III) transport system substrate-binding protein
MRWGHLGLSLVVLAVWTAACAPTAERAAGGASPQQAAQAPAPAAGAEWDRIVAAAKQEGKVLVLGPPGADARDALTQGFQRQYPEIQVDFNAARGAEHATKLVTERQAGQYLADIVVNGTTTQIDLMDAGVMDPLRPLLVGPDDRDPSKWLNGEYEFSDDAGQYNLVFTSAVKVPIAYNPRLVSPSEIRSYRDLLDAKWRGKMAWLDPRTAGTGLAFATFLDVHPALGRDYLGRLLDNGMVFSKDERQLLDWVARGQYLINIAPSEFFVVELMKKGVTLELMYSESIQEGSYLTAAWGAVGAVNRPAHPNAAKVYLNWLLSQEGQTDIARAGGYPSRRVDVPTDFLSPGVVPKAGVKYVDYYREPFVRLKEELIAYLQTAIRN